MSALRGCCRCSFSYCRVFPTRTWPNKKNFLVLHSFHQGYEWTDSVQQGILDELAPRRKDVSCSVEYLDSIRYPEASHLGAVCELFRELPVVFCGVNEAISVRETIEIALKLRPSAKTVAVVAGYRPAEIRNLEMAKAAEPFFKGRVAFEYLYGFEPEEIANRLKELSSEDIVLYLSLPLLPSLPFREKALCRGEQDVCPRGTPFFFTRPGTDWPRPGTSSSSTASSARSFSPNMGRPCSSSIRRVDSFWRGIRRRTGSTVFRSFRG